MIADALHLRNGLCLSLIKQLSFNYQKQNMKNIKILGLFFVFFILPKVGSSQLVYAELGGAGGAYSINYDTRFSAKTKLGFRVGFSFLPGFESFFYLPVQINYVSSGSHGIEVGVGVTVSNEVKRFFARFGDDTLLQTVTLAYRFPTKKSFKFRLGFTSFTNAGAGSPGSLFWPTASIGYQF